MLRSICFLLLTATLAFVDANSTKNFERELTCRKDIESDGDGMHIYIFCAVPIILTVIQVAAVAFMVWFVQCKLFPHINEVIEKTHTIMDAVLVTLLPKGVLVDVAAKEPKDGIALRKKSKESKKEDEEE